MILVNRLCFSYVWQSPRNGVSIKKSGTHHQGGYNSELHVVIKFCHIYIYEMIIFFLFNSLLHRNTDVKPDMMIKKLLKMLKFDGA